MCGRKPCRNLPLLAISELKGTRGRDLKVDMNKNHLKVALTVNHTNNNSPIVDAMLTKNIVVDDSFWTVEDGSRLVVYKLMYT